MAGNLTLALIKPHIHFNRQAGKVIQRIEEGSFAILLCKLLQLRAEGAEQFYAEHKGKSFFPNLIKTICSGPVWVLVLAKENAVEGWRDYIGATDPAQAAPGSIRYDFGDHANITNNAVHGSSDDWAARREINFFFHREIAVAGRLYALENEQK